MQRTYTERTELLLVELHIKAMPVRFSKKALADHLQARMTFVQKDWGFDPNSGTAQIDFIATDRQRTNPLSFIPPGETSKEHHLAEAQRAYGEINALAAIADHFELDEVSEIKDMRPTPISKPYVRYRPV